MLQTSNVLNMKRIVFLFVFSSFIVVGCSNKPEPEQDRQVVIFVTPKSLTNSSLKSSATFVEDEIQKILLFGVDDQNGVEEIFVTNTPSPNGVTLTISRKIKSFYAIANPSPEIESANPSNVSALNDMMSDFSNHPMSPFLMSGKASIIDETVHIELVRVVAKIRIIGENDFQISSVTVMNTSSKGYVFSKTPFSVPTGKTDYEPIISSNPTFYVAENTTVSPTKLVVSGQLYGKQAHYTIEQLTTNGGKPVDILRNTYYEVSVTPNTEYECSIKITILDWADIPVDSHTIPDENFE